MSTLFDEFGKSFIENVRDEGIKYWDWVFVDKELPANLQHHQEVLDKLSEAQLAMFYDLGPYFVDGLLHDLLLFLEDAEWIQVKLKKNNEIVENMKDIAKGDLQGYIYIWAEEYSKKRLSDE